MSNPRIVTPTGAKFADLSAIVADPALRVISTGLGVQSTALKLAAEYGLIGPTPDLAIWADPGGEAYALYEHLAWLRSVVSFPIIDVRAGHLEAELQAHFATGKRVSAIPWKLIGPDGKKGQAMRQCTSDKKIRPVRKEIRRQLGVKPKCRVPKGILVEQWLGISTDEVERVQDSDKPYIVNRYPLLELGWSRTDCEGFVRTLYPGQPVAKSACVFCPFADNARWRQIRRDPTEWARAVAIDRAGRESPHSKMRGVLFLHHSRVPLEEADLGAADPGEGIRNECGGRCGL